MISGVDHIALIVGDLEKAIADYRLVLGREPNWRGTLEGARHAWFQLPNVALDIIAPADEGRFGSRAKERLSSGGEGVWAIAGLLSD